MITENHDIEQDLREQIRKLQLQIGEKDKAIHDLKKKNAELLHRAIKSESDIKPVRDSLNSLTAEKSRWMRKARKAGINLQ